MSSKKILIIGAIVVVLIAGLVTVKVLNQSQKQDLALVEEEPIEEIELLPDSVTVDVTKSKVKDNTIVLSITGLVGNYTSVAYEISYDSQGVTQGVTSKPLEISGKDTFTRDDIYLGTCSRNVCRPHVGVKQVSLVLEFTNVSGKKSQFSKDYDL